MVKLTMFAAGEPQVFRKRQRQGAHLGGLTRAIDLRKGLQGVKVGVLQVLERSRKHRNMSGRGIVGRISPTCSMNRAFPCIYKHLPLKLINMAQILVNIP